MRSGGTTASNATYLSLKILHLLRILIAVICSLLSVRAISIFSTYSHSIVLGGLLLTSYTTRVTPFTSFTIRVDILSSTSPGNLTQSAVIASSDCTTRTATVNPYVLPSPITPTLRTGSSTANACHTFSYNPARRISSTTIASASRSVSKSFFVIVPSSLTASPGPGNGCFTRISSGSPKSFPIRRTSSLNKSRNGSTSANGIFSGNPPTLWCDLIVADGPFTDTDSITSGYNVPCTRNLMSP